MTSKEQRFRALFENTHVALYELDDAGVFRDANQATADLTGIPRDELIGRPVEDVVAPEHVERARELLAATLQGARREFELDIVSVHRGRRTIAGVTVPAEMAGEIESAFATARDVTEERERKRRLELQAGLLSAVQQAVIATDLDGEIIFWNRYAEELYGWTAEEAMGRDILMLVPEDETERAQKVLADVARGTPWSGDFTVRRKDGSTFTALIMDAPLRNDEGTVIGYVGISVDVTEKRRAEERELQIQKMSAVGHLAGGIAHDFNNLLTAIHGHVGLLLMDTDGEIRDELLEIEQNVQRGSALTRRLLAFSRDDREERTVQEVGPVIRGLASLLGRLLGDHVLTKYRVEPGLHARIAPTRLEQVVVNLALNARDAMPGGGSLRIGVRRAHLERDLEGAPGRVPAGEYVRLDVVDDGTGMDEETLARIFEPFFTTKEPDRGTGLGLATVQRIVSDHDGHCLVRSRPGEGTEVRIYLPAAAAEARAGVESDPHPDASPSGLGGVPAGPVGADRDDEPCVLVVDDDRQIRRIAERLLRRQGYRARSLGTGGEALELFRRDGVEVAAAIVDVGLPDMDGREVCLELRDVRPELPVLITSGLDPEEVTDWFEGLAPPPPVLAKPFEVSELVGRVEAMMASSSARSGAAAD